MEDGVLSEDDISYLPSNLLDVIHSSVDEIITLYKASDFDIISQYFDKKSKLDKTDWEILFTLIRLGHYDVSQTHLKEAIEFYNETFYCNINSVDDILDSDDPILYGKFHNRISFMKKDAEELCLRMNH